MSASTTTATQVSSSRSIPSNPPNGPSPGKQAAQLARRPLSSPFFESSSRTVPPRRTFRHGRKVWMGSMPLPIATGCYSRTARVRVLEVRVPPGTKEPFHVHPWPSIFIYLDSGGPMAAQRYYNKDGKVTHGHPRIERPPLNPPEWRIHWMEPEPLHAIENMETVESSRTLPYRLPTLRVEFKGADSQGRTR